MRFRSIGYALAVVTAGSLVMMSSKTAVSQSVPDLYVKLQASSPGITQTGSMHISSVAWAGLFKGSGAGLTNLAAPSITTGLLNDARLSPRVPLTNQLNTFSAVQRFASNILMTSTQNSIIFPAVTGTPKPMIEMFLTGTSNADRMVIAHSPDYPDWGLQYRDGSDDMVFMGSGSTALWIGLDSLNVGVQVDSPQIDFAIGDNDTGLNWNSDGNFALTANNSPVVTVTPSAVGFGTTSPTSFVHAVDPLTTRPSILAESGQVAASTIHPSGFFYFAALEGAGRNGVIGAANAGFDGYGVTGLTPDSNGRGVYGWASEASGNNYGVYGESASAANGYGVFAAGRSGASGVKSFRIDHPADPTHKYLLHYSAEGPEPLNLYSGTIRTGQDGFATVTLPPYYESINKDARIQLTVEDESDDFVMVKVVRGVSKGQFTLRTTKPSTIVYWRVEATRNDRFVQQYGAPVEQDKLGGEYGRYQHPELYGYGPELGYRQSKQQVEKINP